MGRAIENRERNGDNGDAAERSYNFSDEEEEDEEYEDEFERRYKLGRGEAMKDEGVADWTLEREQMKYAFLRQQRIKNGDVGFLMRIKSKQQFEHKNEEELVKYLKAKLKDLAHNY